MKKSPQFVIVLSLVFDSMAEDDEWTKRESPQGKPVFLRSGQTIQDFNLFGYLFEDMCVRDLRCYTLPLRGDVFHYHDQANMESDAVIRLYDGRWALIEVKTGSKQIEDAAKNLLKLASTIDTDKIGEPSFLMILTAGQFAYRRKDGVLVVPIGCLKP